VKWFLEMYSCTRNAFLRVQKERKMGNPLFICRNLVKWLLYGCAIILKIGSQLFQKSIKRGESFTFKKFNLFLDDSFGPGCVFTMSVFTFCCLVRVYNLRIDYMYIFFVLRSCLFSLKYLLFSLISPCLPPPLPYRY
jgi:hypothetical protein